MKRVFIIIGPESSGTRVVTRLFIKAGCFGEGKHLQALDKFIKGEIKNLKKFSGNADTIVFRRSIPHGVNPVWIKFNQIEKLFTEQGYKVFWIVTMRDWSSLARSKVRRGHKKNLKEAKESVKKEYSYIASGLVSRTNYYMLMISDLFKKPKETLRRMVEWIEFEIPDGAVADIFNADKVDNMFQKK